MTKGLPDFTRAYGISVEAKVPEIALTKYGAYADSKVHSTVMTADAAGQVTWTTTAGGRWFNLVHVLTIHPDETDWLAVEILRADGTVYSSPIPKTAPIYFYADISVEFVRPFEVPKGGSIRVTLYATKAKRFNVEVETLA